VRGIKSLWHPPRPTAQKIDQPKALASPFSAASAPLEFPYSFSGGLHTTIDPLPGADRDDGA
jgi:hypothetical protein